MTFTQKCVRLSIRMDQFMPLPNPDNLRDDPLYESPLLLNLTIIERISRLTKYRDNGCWEYHGHFNNKGYGQIHYQGKHQLVHRISFKLMKGRIPKGKFVLHRCDNTRCYNPDHLFIGTQKDNMDDMRAKGRDNDFGRKEIPFRPEEDKAHMKRRFL